jgi:RHS repeat-associated protein
MAATFFNPSTYGTPSNAQFVTDLYKGFLQRDADTDGYNFWLGILNSENDRNHLIRAFQVCEEFANNIAAICTTTSSTSSSIKYVFTDVQGSTRAIMNNNGSSSVVVSRHDYLPFGVELWAGIGLRSSSQTYGATDVIRHKYGSTQRDDATGLDHTWFRKYESLSGRWTSPDPLNGDKSSPQSFNRYAYTENDPVNSIDPNGLCTFNINISGVSGQALTDLQNELTRIFASGGHSVVFGHADQANGGSMNLNVVTQYSGATLNMITSQKYDPNTIPGATGPGSSDSFVNSAVIGRLDPSRATSVMQTVSLGTAMGRVGAHEVIQHGLLGQAKETTSGDITESRVSTVTLFNPQTTRFNIGSSAAASLSNLCPPTTTPQSTLHEALHGGLIGGGGIPGGGGPYIGGGGYPSWWYSMWEFVDWVNSIGGGYGEVIGYEIDDPEEEGD